MGLIVDGGCAEYVRCPEVNCLPYPQNLDWEHPAAVPLVLQTARHMLVNRAQLQSDEDVLVIVAGSGVGARPFKSRRFSVRA
jgi:NADPH:quinone reductase